MTRTGTRQAKRIDCVLIDFYGTIAAGDREAVEATCQTVVASCGLPVSAAEFAVMWGERYFATVGECNHHAFRTLYECELSSLEEMLTLFGVEADPEPFVAQLEAYWRNPPIHEDALEFLASLALPVCCVSNADDEPLHSAIGKHGLRFDAVISSEAVRCYKPDTGIFRRAVSAMGVDPVRAIHVGDSLHSDIGGASAAGIATAWIRRENRIHDIGRAKPTHTIARLTELPALLG